MNRAVLVAGETLGLAVNVVPGNLASSSAARIGFGGAESTVAIGLRRLGVASTWVSRIGDDSVGRLIRRELAAEGVRVIAPTGPGSTGFMLKTRERPDRTDVSFWRRESAATALSPSDVDDELLRQHSLIHLTGITPALSESAQSLTTSLIQRARSFGITVSFDINYRSRLWSRTDASAFLRDTLPFVDVLFAGPDEAALVTDAPASEEMARSIASYGPQSVVIKLGAQGCISLCKGEVLTMSARPAAVIDTVGAGDAFVAGYLAELVLGRPHEQRVKTAVIAGARACEVVGDWEGTPRRDELIERNDPVMR